MCLLVLKLEPEYQLQNIVFTLKEVLVSTKEGYWDSDHFIESEATLSVNVQLTYMYQWIEGLWSTTLLFLFTCKSMAIILYLIIIIIVVVVVVVVYIEDITCPHMDMNVIFKCSTRYLTRCLLYKLMFII